MGVLILWVLDKFFPKLWVFLTDRVFPTRAKERAEKLEREEREANARRKADETLLDAKLEQEKREQEHRRNMEERTTKAIELMAGNQAIGNERMAVLIASFGQLQSYIVSAVQDMRLVTQQFHSGKEITRPPKKAKAKT